MYARVRTGREDYIDPFQQGAFGELSKPML